MFLLTQLPSLHSGAHSFLPDQNLTSESDQSSVDCCKNAVFTVTKLLDMFDNEMLEVQSTRETLFLRLKCVCVCVCVCVQGRGKVFYVGGAVGGGGGVVNFCI